MFEGVDLTLYNPPTVPPVGAGDIPFGTRVEEMLDYALRLTALAALGDTIRRGDNLNEVFQDDAETAGAGYDCP